MLRNLMIGAFATTASATAFGGQIFFSAKNPNRPSSGDRVLHTATCHGSGEPYSAANAVLPKSNEDHANDPHYWTVWKGGDGELGAGSQLIMSAENDVVGRELFLASASGGIRLYKDLNKGTGSSDPADIVMTNPGASTNTRFLFTAMHKYTSGDLAGQERRRLYYSNGDDGAEEVQPWDHDSNLDYELAESLTIYNGVGGRRAAYSAVPTPPVTACEEVPAENLMECLRSDFGSHLVITPVLGSDGVEATDVFKQALTPLSVASGFTCTNNLNDPDHCSNAVGDVTLIMPQHLMGIEHGINDGLFFSAELKKDGTAYGRHPCWLRKDQTKPKCFIIPNAYGMSIGNCPDDDFSGAKICTFDAFSRWKKTGTSSTSEGSLCFGTPNGLYCLPIDQADDSSPVFLHDTRVGGEANDVVSVAWINQGQSHADYKNKLVWSAMGLYGQTATTAGLYSSSDPSDPDEIDEIKIAAPCKDVPGYENSMGGTCENVHYSSSMFSSNGDCGMATVLGDGDTDGSDHCCRCAVQVNGGNQFKHEMFPDPLQTWAEDGYPHMLTPLGGSPGVGLGFTFYAATSGGHGLELYTSLGNADKPWQNQIVADYAAGAADSVFSLPPPGDTASCGCSVHRCDHDKDGSPTADGRVCYGRSYRGYGTENMWQQVSGQEVGTGALSDLDYFLTQQTSSYPGYLVNPGADPQQLSVDPRSFTCEYMGSDTPCKNEISKVACESFNVATDFRITQLGSSKVRFTNNLPVDKTLLVIGNGPWDREKTITENGGVSAGCIFTQSSSLSFPSGTYYGPSTNPGVTCEQDVIEACTESRMRVDYTLEHLVSGLNDQGKMVIYYHRIQANPITGPGIVLLWMAENACKIYVDVEFECNGGDCVEVTTIVCASFAGIDASNNGKMRIECKVPASWDISTTNDPTQHAIPYPQQTATVTNSEGDFPTSAGGATGYVSSFVSGRAQWDFTSLAPVGAAGATVSDFTGNIVISGSVRAGTDAQLNVNIADPASQWTVVQEIYSAPYNLSLASRLVDGLTMPVMVMFHADQTSSSYSDVNGKFPTCGASCDTVPFLAKQEIEYGDIKSSVNAFLRIVAKVPAPNHDFSQLQITDVTHTTPDTPLGATLRATCYTGGNVGSGGTPGTVDRLDGFGSTPGQVLVGPTSNYPQATVKCTNFMADSADDTTPNVNAGDTVTFSLSWRLRRVVATSGKAMLLQDAPTADPADQTVSVKMAVEFGSATTNVEIGNQGGDEGAAGASSGGNTAAYIIIAVVVVAVAVCLAGAVVVYLCLRTKGKEEPTQYSPAKYEVSAVYDITGPKRPGSAPAPDV